MKWSLMHNNNITENDIDALITFLSQRPLPKLTRGKKVKEFEEKWSNWLGVKYSVFVNSGSSANILTLRIIKNLFGDGEIITTPFGWVSDITSIRHAGLVPVFVDIKFDTLSIDESKIIDKITLNTKAILLTHILGYNGLSQKLLDICKNRNILLIEDACESHGTTFMGKKVGSFGDVSNFSFYFAHHMTSIEGGMICTNNFEIYNLALSYRSHAMLREMEDDDTKTRIAKDNPELTDDFIFIADAYNMRPTELNAVLALNQLQRLDENNVKRRNNLDVFLDNLDSKKYYINFNREGNSNYALTLLLNQPNMDMRNKVENALMKNDIEFRRGMSGGGNQLRQPYLRKSFGDEYKKYPNCEYIHHYGWYIGNYPELEKEQIIKLVVLLNNI